MGGMQGDRGRCVNCGFLGLRGIEGAGLLTAGQYEISHERRASGDIWGMYEGLRGEPIRVKPFCFVGASDIDNEISPSSMDREQATRAAFENHRNCKFWYRHNPGLSPTDHFDMLRLELLEQSRRDFEERLQKDKKDFDERLDKERQRSDKFNKKMNWFFAILAILSLAGTLAQLVFPNGIPSLVRAFETTRTTPRLPPLGLPR